MSLVIGDNFDYKSQKPLDARLKYDDLATMKAVADATMYEGCMCYCVATDKTYQWKSSNTVDADTGKWREFAGGGGEDDKAYHTDDQTITSIVDEDFIPTYYTNASDKRKISWSNIKSVLKTYFDTIYSTVTTSKTAASGGTDLSLVTTGEKYDTNTNVCWYATSSTTASTTAKVATLSRGTFTLVAGAKVSVKFTYTNTASAPTLNIGSTGAKNIKYYNADSGVTTPTKWWKAGDIVSFIYDGTQYLMQPTYSISRPFTIQTKTLAANATTLTFSDVPNSGDYTLTLYTSDPNRAYVGATRSGTTVTYQFISDTNAMTCYLKIEEM